MKLKTEIEKVRNTKTKAINDINYSLLPESQLEKKYGVSKAPMTAVAKANPGRSKKEISNKSTEKGQKNSIYSAK